MRKYLGIEFGKVFTGTFPEFKELFGSNHIFKKFQPEKREQELKKAYEIATSKEITVEDFFPEGELKEIQVNEAKIEDLNGDTSRTANKSKKNSAGQAEK
jgi:hypothetical protein